MVDYKFETRVGDIASSRPAWAIYCEHGEGEKGREIVKRTHTFTSTLVQM